MKINLTNNILHKLKYITFYPQKWIKKQFFIPLIGLISLTFMSSQVLAENYNYKVYNPQTRESFSAEMITIGFPSNTYTIGLSKAMIICEIATIGSKENNLLGGKCTDIKNSQTYYWKEYKAKTFNSELKSIIKEKNAENKNLDDSAHFLLPKDFEIHKIQSSDKNHSNYWEPYMEELTGQIKRNWTPPVSGREKVVEILFKISKDGELLSYKIQKSSGIAEVDKSAVDAIFFTAPFRPIPAEYKGQSIDILFTFDYHRIQ